MTNTLRFIVLQAVLAAGLVALWFTGDLAKPFIGESRYFSGFVLAVALIGLFCVWRQKYAGASWIAAILVRIAIVGMLVGCISALGAVSQSVLTGGDTMKVMAVFLGNIGVAFYVSLVALSSNLWLELNLKLLGDGHEG